MAGPYSPGRLASNISVVVCVIAVYICLVGASSSVDVNSRDVSISDINILLPYTTKQRVTYRIHAQNGCFRWTSSNREVVTVQEIRRTAAEVRASGSGAGAVGGVVAESVAADCADSADITVAASPMGFAARSHAWIQAEDRISGRILTCEVYVDRIARIEIETTTRTMFKDDIERLDILAFDQENNLFSTVKGLKFRWSINPSHSVLQFVRPQDVSVSDVAVDFSGLESGKILLKAENTGKATVTSNLLEEGKFFLFPTFVFPSFVCEINGM